ncbi:MAG: hypothetical protein IJV90_05025 [Candidatus Methanomethylophilaceae archaeon]|nr:hypothetical protein [Candidatus Methanomethylophilaceae archaeon]
MSHEGSENLRCIFESLCERDLRICADTFKGRLFHYRDYNNLEADSMIEMPDGRWYAFKIEPGALMMCIWYR